MIRLEHPFFVVTQKPGTRLEGDPALTLPVCLWYNARSV